MVPQFLMVEKFARFLLVVLGRCVGTENNKQNLNRNRNSKEKNLQLSIRRTFPIFLHYFVAAVAGPQLKSLASLLV